VIGTMWARGRRLHAGIHAHAADLDVAVSVDGLPAVGELQLPAAEARLAFEGECLRRGVILYSVLYPNFSHADSDIDEALVVIGDALAAVQSRGLLA